MTHFLVTYNSPLDECFCFTAIVLEHSSSTMSETLFLIFLLVLFNFQPSSCQSVTKGDVFDWKYVLIIVGYIHFGIFFFIFQYFCKYREGNKNHPRLEELLRTEPPRIAEPLTTVDSTIIMSKLPPSYEESVSEIFWI